MRFSRFYFIFFLLFFFLDLRAGYDYRKITKTQTEHIIDSLKHSIYRTEYLDYDYAKDILQREMIYINNGDSVQYEKVFYPNGKPRAEGLNYYYSHTLDNRIGTWLFYDTTGHFFKEYDFSTDRKKLYGIKEEKYQNVFDSLQSVTRRFLIERFGKEFFDAHIRISPYTAWNSSKEFYSYSNSYPDMPNYMPDQYLETISYLFFNDTINAQTIILEFDSTMKTPSSVLLGDISKFHPCINYDYNQANAIAKKEGFDANVRLNWNEYAYKYFWETSGVNTHHDDNEFTESKSFVSFTIDACSGEFYTNPVFQAEEDVDGFNSVFTKPWKDTVRISPGWKEVYTDGLAFNVPKNWVELEVYRGSHTYFSFSNGTDSIGVSADSYMSERLERIELATLPKHYILADGRDSIVIVPPRNPYDTASYNKFMKYYPDKTIQGRSMELEIYSSEDGWYDVSLHVSDSGVGFGGTLPNWRMGATHVNAKQRDEILKIFRTIRFSTY